jgi:drug/metabolite transporter (DMT)-like permease
MSMMETLRRWPPILWPLMTAASLLILAGASGEWRPGLLIAGGVLAVVVLALALYLATRGHPDRPRPPIVNWAIAGLAVFYLAIAVAAATAGLEYAVAALAAAVVPMAALCLLLALMRSKTVESDGHLRDISAEGDDDPYPGIGMDSTTPLGDTPEHSDARS